MIIRHSDFGFRIHRFRVNRSGSGSLIIYVQRNRLAELGSVQVIHVHGTFYVHLQTVNAGNLIAKDGIESVHIGIDLLISAHTIDIDKRVSTVKARKIAVGEPKHLERREAICSINS